VALPGFEPRDFSGWADPPPAARLDAGKNARPVAVVDRRGAGRDVDAGFVRRIHRRKAGLAPERSVLGARATRPEFR
jgi:hypothetical protein